MKIQDLFEHGGDFEETAEEGVPAAIAYLLMYKQAVGELNKMSMDRIIQDVAPDATGQWYRLEGYFPNAAISDTPENQEHIKRAKKLLKIHNYAHDTYLKTVPKYSNQEHLRAECVFIEDRVDAYMRYVQQLVKRRTLNNAANPDNVLFYTEKNIRLESIANFQFVFTIPGSIERMFVRTGDENDPLVKKVLKMIEYIDQLRSRKRALLDFN